MGVGYDVHHIGPRLAYVLFMWTTRREASPKHISRKHYQQARKGLDFLFSTASAVARGNELGSLGFLVYACMQATKQAGVLGLYLR